MPFVNQKQRAACWAQYNRDREEGIVPRWNCPKFEKESMHRCRAKTSKGERCKNNVRGGYYCHHHN